MLFISTSNGLFAYDEDKDDVQCVMGNRDGHGWKGALRLQRSYGCFGIVLSDDGRELLVAARAKLGTESVGKPATDMWLFSMEVSTRKVAKIAPVRDVHDVHQIEVWRNYVLLSDTGKNRVHFFSRTSNKVELVVNVGDTRTDVNHINALNVRDNILHIGCNNRGAKKGEIISFALDRLAERGEAELQVEHLAPRVHENPYPSTHDIEDFGDDDFLVCASHAGKVFCVSEGRDLLYAEGEWVRGLAFSARGLWVGSSVLADRAHRHDKSLSGHIGLYDPQSGKRLHVVPIAGAGQINDIVHVK